MPDTSFLAYMAASLYWSLILCWSAILVFYAVEYRRLHKLNPLVGTLIIVIFIDGLRTLVESAYFGTWYTARTGMISYSIFELLTRPEYLVIPKVINLMAAIIIIAFMVRRWFPAVTEESRRHLELSRVHQQLVEAHEELKNLQGLRDDLIDMIAHDMRTPLTSTIGSLQTALDVDPGSEVGRELLDNALHNAQRLQSMTSDLLDIGRMEAGELVLERTDLPIGRALRNAADDASYLADEKNLTLTVEPLDEMLVARADPGIVGRVIMNLLQNAIRHTPPDGRVTLGAQRVEEDGRPMVRIRVEDTGEGIPEHLQERVFDRFFHAASESGAAPASIGLGLAFCRLAVRAHGGAIGVESEVGEGSSFHFTLPLAGDDAGT